MNLTKKIAQHTIIHTLGKFGASLIGVLVVAILTRYLGVEGYGAYTTIFAYLFFFAILSDLGLYVITVNELNHSEYGEEKFFNNIFTLRLVTALILMLVASILVWWLPYSLIIKLGVMVASVSIFLNLLDQLVVAFFQNKINMKRVALAELVGKIILLGLTILIVYLKGNLILLLIAIILGFSVNLGINLSYLNKFIKVKLSYNKQIWRDILKKSWPVALTTIFSLIYFKADTLLLSVLPVNSMFASSNEMAVGIYGAPYKILEVLIAWPAIFMGLVSPLLAKNWAEKNIEKFKQLFQKAFDVLNIIIWPMIIGVVVLAKPLMVLVAGNEFVKSSLPLQILIWAVGIIFLTHLTTYTIIALGQQKKMIKFYVVAAILAVIAYLIFIPQYSYVAAATITVLVELFMLMATIYLLKKVVALKINLLVFSKAVLAAIVMGGCLYFIINLNVVLLILIGAGIYLGVLYLLGGIDKEMIKELR